MWLFIAGLALLLAGALLALVVQGAPRLSSLLGVCGAVSGSLLSLAGAAGVLCSGRAAALDAPWPIPLGSFSLGIDPLSAAFIVPIGLVVAVAAIYGRPYMHGSYQPSKIGLSWFFFNLLAAAMLLVVAARNGLLFLVAWECMSLASFFLVLTDHERDSARHAGWVYLAAMHLGTAALLVLFLLLGRTSGTLDFDRFVCQPGLAGALFVLAVAGFGTKAGLIPLHVWLPEAHPAAPSHVSAVMSGVMIKTGIYGLVRTITFLPELPGWCGWMLLALGAASGILGVLFALAQHDLKKLLAYHSVENIGIITLGLGVGLLGLAHQIPVMVFLGFAGALLHVLNHALFKGLLFLGAGAIQHGTGIRDLDRLGGLLKKMPATGGAFLVGACAICGLPPLNGFVSELLIYLGVLLGIADPGRSGALAWGLLCVLVFGSLALVGGLASACFTKAFGCVFLGEPRSDAARQGHEVGLAMRVAMLVLAGACIGVALAAPLLPSVYRRPVEALVPADLLGAMPGVVSQSGAVLLIVCGAFWALILLAGLLALARRRLLAGRQVDRGPTWGCGYAAPTPRMQYTAASYASPLLVLFRMFVRPRIDLSPPQGLFPKHARYESETGDAFSDYLFRPAFLAVVWMASKVRRFQNGRLQLYVLYIALTILVLLIWKLG